MGDAPRILVVDDEPIVGKRLTQALEKKGYTVEVALSGREAVEKIVPGAFDAIVTDIRMDDMDGIEVLAHTQQHAPTTPVIIITGYATIELAREALARGAFDFIAKPFKPNTLIEVLRRAISEREMQS
ncbi:MAG TPA: sigma-54-dependent Fis family transcriptional regulator [Bacteroidetes bacterium]|nr:sigma-54-dependent Fis family transcriptional regulator [Bacteroidota bacterium]